MDGLAVKGFQWCPSVRMTTSSDPENKPLPSSTPSSHRFLATWSYEPPLVLSCSRNRANELARPDSISSSSKTVARRLAAKSMLDVRYTGLQKGICSFQIEVMRYSWHRQRTLSLLSSVNFNTSARWSGLWSIWTRSKFCCQFSIRKRVRCAVNISLYDLCYASE